MTLESLPNPESESPDVGDVNDWVAASSVLDECPVFETPTDSNNSTRYRSGAWLYFSC